MSDPIVVDDAVKAPPAAKSVAKTEPAKAEPAGAKSAGPFPPPAPPRPAAVGLKGVLKKFAESIGVAPTRRNAAIAASAVFSLAAGFVAVRTMWPGGDAKPPSANQPLTAQPSAPQPAAQPPSRPAAEAPGAAPQPRNDQPATPLPPPQPLVTPVASGATAQPYPQPPTPASQSLPPIPTYDNLLPRPALPMLAGLIRPVYGLTQGVDPMLIPSLAPSPSELLARAAYIAHLSGPDQDGRPRPPMYGPQPLLEPVFVLSGFRYKPGQLMIAALWHTGLLDKPTSNVATGPLVASHPTTPGAAPLGPPTLEVSVQPPSIAPSMAPSVGPSGPPAADPFVRPADAVKPSGGVVQAVADNRTPSSAVAPAGFPVPRAPADGSPGGPSLPQIPPVPTATPSLPAPSSVLPPVPGVGPSSPGGAAAAITPPLDLTPKPLTPGGLPAIPSNVGTSPLPPASPVAPLVGPSSPGAVPPPIQGSAPGGAPLSQPDSTATRVQLTKPADSATAGPQPFPATPTARTPGNDVRPAAAAERPAQTSFDVDLYEARAGDTYETIAREFYLDTRYARALQEYNVRRPVQAGRNVDVPPIGVLRQRYSGMIGGTTGGGRSGTSNPAPAGDWGPANPPRSDGGPSFRPSGGGQTFLVPQGGMSLKAVARQTLGTEQRWGDVHQLNPQFDPSEMVPAGTRLKLPADARLSQ